MAVVAPMFVRILGVFIALFRKIPQVFALAVSANVFIHPMGAICGAPPSASYVWKLRHFEQSTLVFLKADACCGRSSARVGRLRVNEVFRRGRFIEKNANV